MSSEEEEKTKNSGRPGRLKFIEGIEGGMGPEILALEGPGLAI